MGQVELIPMLQVDTPVPFIYGLIDPEEPRHVRYVGMAGTRRDRPLYHSRAANRSKVSHLLNWVRKLHRCGRDYSVVVLEQLPPESTRELVGFVERCYIKSLREIGHDLVNATEGGEGTSGYKHDPADVARRAAALVGRKHSDETRERLRKARRLRVTSNSTRAKCAARMMGNHYALGTVRSEEANQRQRDAMLGRERSAEHCANISASKTPEVCESTSAALRRTWAERKANGWVPGPTKALQDGKLAWWERVKSDPDAYAALCEQRRASGVAAAAVRRAANALLTPRERAQKEIDKLNARIAKLKTEKDNG